MAERRLLSFNPINRIFSFVGVMESAGVAANLRKPFEVGAKTRSSSSLSSCNPNLVISVTELMKCVRLFARETISKVVSLSFKVSVRPSTPLSFTSFANKSAISRHFSSSSNVLEISRKVLSMLTLFLSRTSVKSLAPAEMPSDCLINHVAVCSLKSSNTSRARCGSRISQQFSIPISFNMRCVTLPMP